jgi:hypothetical protein
MKIHLSVDLAAEAFRTSFCDKPVVADMRTMEFGGLEAELAFGARADAMTAMGISPDSEILAAVALARRPNRETICNLFGVAEPVRRARQVAALAFRCITPAAPESICCPSRRGAALPAFLWGGLSTGRAMRWLDTSLDVS